ncbi:MAG TPA: glycosyltransferase family A protein [Anaerolineae bacterium]|nr:glycosyltransferase family A protein [Anaerolineae bacterium]HQI83597.1 glycosyltransferase family A protein [Anaerolineae bacterium]
MSLVPEITFGLIVLNGEPFVRYNLRALYPFAHQIIVVEGATPGATAIATPDGHSTDATLQTLYNFKAHEDPEDKLIIVTAEDEGHPNGFWPGEKHEMSQAYAKRATGNYLWQVDVDEFYKPEDMQKVLKMLFDDPGITAMSFKQIQFWGSFFAYVDGWYLRRGGEQFHRLFRWGPGYTYTTHRPPTVLTATGQDTRALHWLDAETMRRHGIRLYHYSLVFPKQVVEKCTYYSAAAWAQREKAQQWAQDVFFQLKDPYRVHNVYDYPGWLERYRGTHPPQIECLRSDIKNGVVKVELRPTEDIERLLCSPSYFIGRMRLKAIEQWRDEWQHALWVIHGRLATLETHSIVVKRLRSRLRELVARYA